MEVAWLRGPWLPHEGGPRWRAGMGERGREPAAAAPHPSQGPYPEAVEEERVAAGDAQPLQRLGRLEDGAVRRQHLRGRLAPQLLQVTPDRMAQGLLPGHAVGPGGAAAQVEQPPGDQRILRARAVGLVRGAGGAAEEASSRVVLRGAHHLEGRRVAGGGGVQPPQRLRLLVRRHLPALQPAAIAAPTSQHARAIRERLYRYL